MNEQIVSIIYHLFFNASFSGTATVHMCKDMTLTQLLSLCFHWRLFSCLLNPGIFFPLPLTCGDRALALAEECARRVYLLISI